MTVAIALCLLNIVLRWPGEPNPDSDDQYQQILTGRYTDWHPPIMARWWSVLHRFGDGPGPIFTFHLVLYWLGFALVATALARRGRSIAAWAVMAIGALPPLLMLNINIAKDIGLGVTLLCSFGLCFALRSRQRVGTAPRPLPAWALALAAVLLVYAALVRGNAVFAVGPLLLFAVWRRPPRRALSVLVAAGVVLGALLVPVAALINRDVLGSQSSGALESLQFFDVAGIARLTGDDASFGNARVARSDLDRCYSPIMWDTLPQRCPALWTSIRSAAFDGGGGVAGQPSLTHLWLEAIRRHPLAYVEHRLLTFNSTLYLFVPPHHTEYVRKLDTAANRSDRLSARALDAVRYNWLMAPATLLALGCSLLWFATRRTRVSDQETDAFDDRRAALVLLVSATLYTLSFLPFGVATDMRYFFWPSIAVLVATVLLGGDLVAARWRPLAVAVMVGPVSLVLMLIAVSRLTNDATLLLP